MGMALQSLAFVYGALPAWAQAPPPASELQRPALQTGSAGRFNEDWSVLRGVDLQLFPNGHSYLGYIDSIGRQNIISASGGLSMTPVRGLILSLQQYFFWRASDRDAIYNKAGAVLRPGTGTTARYVGAEVDLLATYNFTRHFHF